MFDIDGLFEALKRGEGLFDQTYTENALIDVRDFGTPGLDPVYVGRKEIRRFWMEWFGAWDSMRWQANFYERGEWVVADVFEFVVKGESSGIELEMPHGQTFQFKDGLVDRWRMHPERDLAFAEAGIEPPAA
jgi:hypothetical protein